MILSIENKIDLLSMSCRKNQNNLSLYYNKFLRNQDTFNEVIEYRYCGKDTETIMHYILACADNLIINDLLNYYGLSIFSHGYKTLYYLINSNFNKLCYILFNFINEINTDQKVEFFYSILKDKSHLHHAHAYFNLIKKIYKKFYMDVDKYDIFTCALASDNINFIKYMISKNYYNPENDYNTECIKYAISSCSVDIITHFLNKNSAMLYDNSLLYKYLDHYPSNVVLFNFEKHFIIISYIIKYGNIDFTDGVLLRKIVSYGMRFAVLLTKHGVDLSNLHKDDFDDNCLLTELRKSYTDDTIINLLYSRLLYTCRNIADK